MDALGKSLAIIAVMVTVLCPLCLAEADGATEMDGLMLYQVNPYNAEGVAVKNYGSTDVNLKDYAITDMPALNGGEGKLTFGSIVVKAGDTLVLASKWVEGDQFSNQTNVMYYGGDKKSDLITKTGPFTLNNTGDDVYLFHLDGRCVDAVCYGKQQSTTETYWTGEPASIKEYYWIQRVGLTDTNSAAAWRVYVAGQTDYYFDPNLKFDATVSPFLFPDSGGIPIHDAIKNANSSIRIELYQLLDSNIVCLLCDKIKNDNVDVDILLEGESMAQKDPIKANGAQLKRLVDLGGEIRLIGVNDSGQDRYEYDHAKFAIIDGKKTIVTSENWTSANLNGHIDDQPYSGSDDGNRGWGVIVESVEYSSFMNDIFEHDWSKDYGDVKDLLDKYPTLISKEGEYKKPTSLLILDSYQAQVTPILSNDSSYEALEYYVSNATYRAYSEQQSLSKTYQNLSSGPLSFFAERAASGVDSKLIFNNGIDSDVVDVINYYSNIKATLMSTPTLHNKGVICDDVSWVSSVNWTPNSFQNNREVCVAIHSKEVADYFAKAFLADFEEYYTGDGIGIEFTEIQPQYKAGEEITISVKVTPESGTYTYEWDLGDGSTKISSDIPRIVAKPADGSHMLTVTATSADGMFKSVSYKYTMGESSPDIPVDPDTPADTSKDIRTLLQDYIYYIIAGVIFILGIITAAVKGGRHR